jgi:spore coat protein A
MDSSRRTLLVRGARLMATAAAHQSGLIGQLGLLAQSAPPKPDSMPGMAAHPAPASMPNPAPHPVPARPWLHAERLARFVDPLPALPVHRSQETRPDPKHPNRRIPYYRVAMRKVDVQVHRDLPATSVWSYGATVPGPTFEVRKGLPVLIEWANELPKEHFLPIDFNLHGAGKDQPQVRTAVHVHGAVVPPESDGYPEDWQVPGHSRTSYYPLDQDAATLWYHDHAMGIERLNQYAGLFGFFLIRDSHEDALGLPSGKHEIPLALCDRLFYADGGLHYPDSGFPDAPWVSEVYGDVILVNGVISPYLEVEPCLYRFRVLNCANSRQFQLLLSNGHSFDQIGTDQGLLAAPVSLTQLQIAPAERADLLIDFSGLSGQQFTLQDGTNPLMQFRVKADVKTETRPRPPAIRPKSLRTIEPIPESAAVRTRVFTLNEYLDRKTNAMLMLLNGQYWHEPVTEKPALDSIEIWSFLNTTQDNHPIHLHLVRFQILDRRAFDQDQYNLDKTLNFIGEAGPPEPNERGWKDTVQVHPETVTRIIIPFRGYAGRYVWHCHLLEHAANEMMRPFEVVAPHTSA